MDGIDSPYHFAESHHLFLYSALVGIRDGLHAALRRMVAIDKLPLDLESRYRASMHVGAAYYSYMQPGYRLSDVLQRGIATYAAEGYPEEWRMQWQGGGVGYSYYEPLATPDCHETIAPYSAVAWSSSIGEACSENTYLVLPDHNEILTSTSSWPMIEVLVNGSVYYCPDILRL
jgi:hypothetical protein